MITKIALNPSWLCRQTSCMLNAKRTSFSRRNSRGITDKEEPEFFSDTLPNPVADIEAKIEESKRKLQWRQPMNQPTLIAATDLRFLAPERLKSVFEYFQRPLSQMSLTDALDVMNYQSLCVNQRFIPDRHRILGNDLAAAHFIVARGGQVKFTKSATWVKKDNEDRYDVPDKYDPSYLLQAIKCDGMTLVYDGLENIRRLNHLSYLSFRNVKMFDDWCLDRVCGHQFERLEVLDLSGTRITGNGLIALPKLAALKAVVLDSLDRSLEFQLVCSLLEEAMPKLKILQASDVHDETNQSTKKLDA